MFSGDAGMMGGGQDFAAVPRLIAGQPKFKDPYGRNIEEYFPQNIMHDRRVMRGSTYAAMVIPAGTNPDAMVMEKSYPKKRTFKNLKGVTSTKRSRNIYPNRDIPTPDPVPGRQHMEIQTSEYKEMLTDKPLETEKGIATEFYLDRPPVPLFQPKMPSRDNCKSTQIFEGDVELFDFNKDVEPMLNVLCQKTLEQARMEVLEETEQSIIKSQQKEYEEIVNAELIIAQRYEAAELRCKEEGQRRKVQNKARKQQKKSAHEKVNARIISKGYIAGLREDAMGQLSAMGILIKPRHRSIEQQVVPWLMNQIVDFLMEDQAVSAGADDVVEAGIKDNFDEHKRTIKAKYNRIKKAEEDKIEGEKQKIIRKEKRRLLREKRAKDEALDAFKDQVKTAVIFKGEVVDVLKTNLLDMNSNFNRDPSLGAYGGQIQQIYYVLEEIIKKYPHGLKMYMEKKIANDDEDYFVRPNNPRELLLTDHLLPFFMLYLKEMKNECIEIMMHPACTKFLKEREIDYEALDKLSDDDYMKFKELFIKNKVSEAHKKTTKQMNDLFDFIIDILCKRVPIETINVKVDQIQSKIQLIDIPDGIHMEPYDETVTVEKDGQQVEEVQKKEKNTGEVALLMIKVPQYEQETEIKLQVTGNDMDGDEPKTQMIKKMVDEDQKEKALAISVRDVAQMRDRKHFYHINQFASKAFRDDFLGFMNKTYPEFFDDNDEYNEITTAVHNQAQLDVDNFIKDTCGEYEMPCMEFEINAPEL